MDNDIKEFIKKLDDFLGECGADTEYKLSLGIEVYESVRLAIEAAPVGTTKVSNEFCLSETGCPLIEHTQDFEYKGDTT